MLLAAEQRLSIFALAATGLLVAAIILVPANNVPVLLLAAGGLALFSLWAVLGDLLTATLIWFLTVIFLHEEFWRLKIPFFFNLTIPRLLIVVLALLWVTMWILGKVRLRRSEHVVPLMVLTLAYFTISAAVSGFETIAVASVHYRLIGGYWFAFAVFFFVFHSLHSERQILNVLIFFFLVGAYLAVIGWCEHFDVWAPVFPKYIADPSVGIHWGRARGPFLVSPTMGVALTFCFFSNLVLTRKMSNLWRPAIYLVCLAILPVIFWTHTRSVWLGRIVATIIWMLYTRRHWSRVAGICVLVAAAVLVFYANMESFLSEQRSEGGWTDMEPIYMRLGLALISLKIFFQNPFLGVGFGHFRDVAPSYATDVNTPSYEFASTAMEHNNFLSLLSETGLIGLVLFVVLLVILFRISYRLYKRLPTTAIGPVSRDILVLYWILFAVYLVDGMFRETSVYPFTNSLFFAFSGLVVALHWLLRPQPLRQSSLKTTIRFSRGSRLSTADTETYR